MGIDSMSSVMQGGRNWHRVRVLQQHLRCHDRDLDLLTQEAEAQFKALSHHSYVVGSGGGTHWLDGVEIVF